MVGRPNRIPNFISASSPRGLRRLMLRTNAKARTQFSYFDISYNPTTKKWVAWYLELLETNEQVEELNGSN